MKLTPAVEVPAESATEAPLPDEVATLAPAEIPAEAATLAPAETAEQTTVAEVATEAPAESEVSGPEEAATGEESSAGEIPSNEATEESAGVVLESAGNLEEGEEVATTVAPVDEEEAVEQVGAAENGASSDGDAEEVGDYLD
jgi:hypothetical protein